MRHVVLWSMDLLYLYQNAEQLGVFSFCFYFFFTCIDTVANAKLLEKKIFHDICCLF